MIRLRRLTVSGESMKPAFEPGDRLLVVGPWPVRAGQVVALTDPRRPGRLMVKRVWRVDGRELEVLGDNPVASTDSRHFGPVPRRSVIGRVVYRYAPAPRAGWWP